MKMVDNLGFFEKYPWGKESFSLTLDYLKKRIDFNKQKKTFETKEVSSYALYGFSRAFMRVHQYLIPTVYEMKQHYMKNFKVFTYEPNDTFIDGLKACLEGVTVITSSEDGEDGDDDRDLGGNIISKNVTAGKSKSRASEKTLMIENLEERMFRMKKSIKDIADFIKEERLRRTENERQKKREEDEGVQVQSRHSVARVGRDDSGIKEVHLEVDPLEHASINADEVMIPEVVAVVEKENLDEGDEEK
ncbi:hypothetical protein FXO38_34465 [Capsicum annuum]|nr:hypothetical protein FXO38_34465 [Capsicum annuum]